MDESTLIFPAHIFARIPNWLITPPNEARTENHRLSRLFSWLKPKIGDDMGQTGDDMVLQLSFASNHGRESCSDLFQIAAFNP